MRLVEIFESLWPTVSDSKLSPAALLKRRAEAYILSSPGNDNIKELSRRVDELRDAYMTISNNYSYTDAERKGFLAAGNAYEKASKEYSKLLTTFIRDNKDKFSLPTKNDTYSTDINDLIESCGRWVALEHSSSDIYLILSHPFSKGMNSAQSPYIYRSVFINEDKFRKASKCRAKPQSEKFIAYSESEKWVEGNTRSDFDYSGDILTFRKEFRQQDCLLNFTELIRKIQQETGVKEFSLNEKELWMKSTPYYCNFTLTELVSVDKGD